MMRFPLLVICLVTCVMAGKLSKEIPSVVNCSSFCHSSNEAACEKGCLFAYSLTLAPKNYEHNPSCSESCKDTFVDVQEQNACNFGCAKFDLHNEEGPVSLINPDDFLMSNFIHHCHRKMMNMIGRIRELFSPSHDSDSPVSQSEEPLIKTHVRLVFVAPSEDTKADAKAAPTKIEDLPFIPKPDGDIESEHHSHVKLFSLWTHIGHMRQIFSSPLNLLLALTLLSLLILFVAQIILYVRHGRKRSHGYEYAPLPTYAEAVQVKMPLEVAESVHKPSEKSNMADEDIRA